MTPGICTGCDDPGLRAIAEALAVDDLDRALTLGLLDVVPPDPTTTSCADCAARLATITRARAARRTALEARERHRRRAARLQARAERQAEKRRGLRGAVAPGIDAQPALVEDTHADGATAPASTVARPALPAAAAAALARAKARAATRRD